MALVKQPYLHRRLVHPSG